MRCLLVVFLIAGSFATSYAQQYYVVVGAFAKESNAQKFTGYVRSLRYSAQYELNTAKNYYYVYVLKTTERAAGLTHAKELQSESEFKDAWLFSGQLGTAEPEVAIAAVEPAATPPVDPVVETEVTPVVEIPEEPVSTVVDSASVTLPEPEMKVRGKLFKFTIQRLDRFPLHGDVHIVDYNRGRDLAVYKSDEYIDMPRPNKTNNPMSVVCGIFGFVEVVKEIDYDHPELVPGATQDAKGAWVIPFQLERFKRGDVAVMYHVSFYKDAVVMLPSSKPEIDELLSLMKGNPDYKIKIHGHCNGENSRRIIALGTSKNYFDNKGSDERKGSAKELSKLRAEAIQSYLVDNGIDQNRTSTYAWGALNMLVSEHSPSAKLNDRIEIEILSH